MHHEDAIKFLIENLAAKPDIFVNVSARFDVWLPHAVVAFLRERNPNDPRLTGNPDAFHQPEFEPVWLAFYDAGWQLCRRGIFRLSQTRPEGNGINSNPLGDGYSLTGAGRDWLKNATGRYVPTAPDRYVGVLRTPALVLGGGFLQRAGEAAGCYSSVNYLACCAMCGAAAEAVLLAIAIAKTGNDELVLKKYRQPNGRRNVMRLIFDPPDSTLERRFGTGFGLLTYWRDEAAHGRESSIEELEAYDAMGRLMYLARLAWDNWTELTGKPRPE